MLRNLFFYSVAFAMFAYGVANCSGLCVKEMRFLSDDDKLNKAMRYFAGNENKKTCVRVFGGDFAEASHIVCTFSYENIDEFISKNPSCCKIIKGDDNRNEDGPPSFADRVFGIFNYVVEAEFIEKSANINQRGNEASSQPENEYYYIQKKKIARRIYFSNCGEPCFEVRKNMNIFLSFVTSALGSRCYLD